jgi:hypothetical protein
MPQAEVFIDVRASSNPADIFFLLSAFNAIGSYARCLPLDRQPHAGMRILGPKSFSLRRWITPLTVSVGPHETVMSYLTQNEPQLLGGSVGRKVRFLTDNPPSAKANLRSACERY